MGPPLRGFRSPRIRRCGNIRSRRRGIFGRPPDARLAGRRHGIGAGAQALANVRADATAATDRARRMSGAGWLRRDQAARAHADHERDGTGVTAASANAVGQLGFPSLATKNTTRIPGADPAADAAGVALAVYPSAGPGTHPGAVTLAPTD